MHHGLVEHMPFQSAFSDYLIEDWKIKQIAYDAV